MATEHMFHLVSLCIHVGIVFLLTISGVYGVNTYMMYKWEDFHGHTTVYHLEEGMTPPGASWENITSENKQPGEISYFQTYGEDSDRIFVTEINVCEVLYQTGRGDFINDVMVHVFTNDTCESIRDLRENYIDLEISQKTKFYVAPEDERVGELVYLGICTHKTSITETVYGTIMSTQDNICHSGDIVHQAIPVRVSGKVTPCPPLVAGQNAEFVSTFSEDGLHDTLVTYSCTEGFQFPAATLSVNITCSQGQWSDPFTDCQQIRCQPPANIANGEIAEIKDEYVYDESASYKCSEGFILVGNSAISCQYGGWDSEVPYCKAISCSPPRIPSSGGVFPQADSYTYGQTVTFRCKKGHILEGPESAVCGNKGSWSGPSPSCTVITCDKPGAISNGRVLGSREVYIYGDSATYTCNKGYTLKGNSDVTCLDEGWDSTGPQCVVTTCTPPAPVDHGTMIPKKTTYRYNENIKIRCDKNFTTTAPSTVRCGDNGVWTPEIPKCQWIYGPEEGESVAGPESDGIDAVVAVLVTVIVIESIVLVGLIAFFAMKGQELGYWPFS